MGLTAVKTFSIVHDFLNDKLGFGYGPTGLSSQSSGWWTESMKKPKKRLSNIPLNNNRYGAHDWGNNYLGFSYGADGFTFQNSSFAQKAWSEFMNIVNVPLMSPLAVSNLVGPGMLPWLRDYYENLQKGS